MIRVEGKSVSLNGGGRGYITTTPREDLSPDMFYDVDLTGKQLCYEVDLSEVGCSCNAGLYTSQMPGYGSN